jgi:hypothetical protein
VQTGGTSLDVDVRIVGLLRMDNQGSPFVVQELRARNAQGGTEATYELTRASVSPQRVIGRDAAGYPLMDTVPTVYWRPFLSGDGCINKVPLRTGSVPSMDTNAVAYENETIYDLVVEGWIPAWLCPYSTKYTHITGGQFAASTNGETDCGGGDPDKGGCVHLQKIGKMRRERVKREYDASVAAFSASSDAEKNRMIDGIAAGVSEAMARHMSPQAKLEAAKAGK